MKAWFWVAFGSMLAWSAWAVGLKWAVDRCGWRTTSFLANLVETLICLGIFLVNAGRPEDTKGSYGWGVGAAVLAGAFASLGIVLHNLALVRGDVSVVTAVTACYPIMVAGVGIFLLKDRLTWVGVTGIVLGAVALILVGMDQISKE